MTTILQSVEELIEQSPDRDNQEAFRQMWAVLCELREKLGKRFELTLDPSVEKLASYDSLDGSAKGHLTAWTGPEVDWMVHSFMGTPAASFTNMHLTVWLGPQVKVPHFGMAMGTIPDMFMYLDYVPRVDIQEDLAYLDQYYEPQNKTFLDFEADPEFTPFVSKSLYMRQAQSRTSLCYCAKPNELNIEKVRKTAHEMLDRWLQWVDLADKIPATEQAKLAERDLHIRRSIAERDPANVMGDKIFGPELTKELVGSLWGENRKSLRAGEWQQ